VLIVQINFVNCYKTLQASIGFIQVIYIFYNMSKIFTIRSIMNCDWV